MIKALLVALILVFFAGVIDALNQAYTLGHDAAVDSLSAQIVVLADGLTVALDDLVKCELSRPGHIVFPSDTAIRLISQ